jgi:membrane-associated phospholipid phosphatase
MKIFIKMLILPLLLVLLIHFLYPLSVFAEEQAVRLPADQISVERDIVPLSTLFFNIGENTLGSFTFNYGANFAAAGLGTLLFIESGIDWKWRNFAYNNESLANVAYSSVMYAGYIIPSATPVMFYMAGLLRHSEKMQITAMALAQSMALASGIHAVLKLTTGRSEPYIIDQYHHERINTSDQRYGGDFSGRFDWFKMNLLDGWPSGHTLSAFATAATISEIYKDNLSLKIVFYSYAVLIGLGVSLNVHWASDVFAGALMGYAIGTTVGRSFSKLINPVIQHEKVSFYITAEPFGVLVRF